MRGESWVTLLFFLIFAGIVARHWQGANALLGTGVSGGNTIIKTLEA